MDYKTIIKKVLILIVIFALLFFSAKLSMFYVPFLIAYIISLIVEPIIKFINKKTNLSRKSSSVIVLVAVFVLLIAGIVWGIITLITESTDLLAALNSYFEKTIEWINGILGNINLDKLTISDEIKTLISDTSSSVLNKVIDFVKNILTNFLGTLKSIPKMMIYIVITMLATYFIASDKIYIWDRLEHHFPKKILGKISDKSQKITKSLGGYLKAQITLIGISFVIVLMGLNIFYLLGMNVGYPLLMAIFIGFVDALPILRFWDSNDTLDINFTIE